MGGFGEGLDDGGIGRNPDNGKGGKPHRRKCKNEFPVSSECVEQRNEEEREFVLVNIGNILDGYENKVRYAHVVHDKVYHGQHGSCW